MSDTVSETVSKVSSGFIGFIEWLFPIKASYHYRLKEIRTNEKLACDQLESDARIDEKDKQIAHRAKFNDNARRQELAALGGHYREVSPKPKPRAIAKINKPARVDGSCIYCGGPLSGRQTKFCCTDHKSAEHNKNRQ